ncbi:Zinc finger and SCAN domain-containing protein 5B [Pseudolycoriella hygida]|uniref:Zinc finger and SCAN domain-containing protein 5B n=1 Tax=Pseudolycoriella hygida TaxID=35572 RepID=A0A9Q0MJR0_9DIPT|nr:Zinc finger and SCAN domain-containing protein 5B [Pseudolycoriella hygida]
MSGAPEKKEAIKDWKRSDAILSSSCCLVVSIALDMMHQIQDYPLDLSIPKDTNRSADPSQPKTNRRRQNKFGKVLLECEICSKQFDRPSLLKRHSRVHTGERPHLCLVCNKRFSTSSSLNTHSRIHSGEKPHRCMVCQKCFTASSNLYYHRMTHYKNKPHKCMLCPKTFSTPGDLKGHYYKHTVLRIVNQQITF